MRLVEEAVSRFGRLDIVVNNAGILETKEFAEMESRDWEEMFRVHVFGSINLARAALDYMLLKGGVIVNVSYVAGDVLTISGGLL